MFFEIQHISVDYDRRALSLTENPNPVFTWSARHTQNGAYQSAYSITVACEGTCLWDSGEIRTSRQRAVYAGAPLCPGEIYEVTLVLQDRTGNRTAPKSTRFRFLGERQWNAKWITTEQQGSAAKYFYKGFQLDRQPVRATLYASGIGYQYLTVNGLDVEKSFLNPAVSHYKKLCYYTVTDVTDALQIGQNGIFAVVGDGWRDPKGFFENKRKREDFFAGGSQLIAELELQFADGSRYLLATDESWMAGDGPITENSLFNGETYDARKTIPLWDTPEFTGAGMRAAVAAQEAVGVLCPQTLQPVTEQERLKARTIRRTVDGAWIFDFGINIAGVCRLSVPAGIAPDTRITIEYAEEILPDGDLDKETLRAAKVTDTFIAGEENPASWKPRLTYHGFRYAKLSGYPGLPDENTLEAITFCNNIRSRSFFRCGDPLINQLQENILRTEKNNLHHLATDCPQRDERMGWMNDATVRFEESPYNFYMGRLFPKILKDVALDQSEETGSITDTAPSVWGSQPADPVCSSFLVMGLEMALHYGDTEMIRQYYMPFKRWNQCLAQLCNDEGIIEYSSYGDWAGPADFCDSIFDGRHSTVTPGALMSTGYHYYNYKLLAQFAGLLGDSEEQTEAEEKAEQVRGAFLKKWFDPQQGYVHNGSQGAQAFALWLGILPPEREKLAARRMQEAVKNVGYRLTTGNLTTKYLVDMLAKFGYADTAWKLLTRQEYPSWGYMIQNGATTVWERFECKRGSNMNSHDHPMYGAVGYWFYAYLLGITPMENGWQRFRVMPCYPEELLYAEGRVDTETGEIYVRWQRQMGSIDLLVDVPFGTEATVVLPDGERIIASGCYDFHFEE